MSNISAYRASILHCLRDPGDDNDSLVSLASGAVEYFEDGLLLVVDGYVDFVGPANEMLKTLPSNVQVIDYRNQLIIPGLIDCHVHYPQVDIIASYGERLLDWLEKYAYPAERRFVDANYAKEIAEHFVQELLRNGTTTACVFATVHPQSVDAIFEAASDVGMRLISGKVLMDRNCPEDLRDNPRTAYEQSRQLIDKWHGHGRLSYAVTPRFAITSSEKQLREAGRLLNEYPDVYLHTHLAENEEEVEQVARQFPWSRSYLDVYENFELLRERSIFAHCIHLNDDDRKQMANKGAAIAFCPSSNLFLGSGLFDFHAARQCNVRVGAGSDVGGGTSLSMLRTLGDGYKVLQLRGEKLTPFGAFYLATLGAAKALYLDDRIGSFEKGKEADFIVLDPARIDMLQRGGGENAISNRLFAMFFLGDNRVVREVYLMGQARRPLRQAELAQRITELQQ
ncbi:MAG: guanine deaminase [Woeseia sp.]